MALYILQIKLADKLKLCHVSSSVTDAHHFLSNVIYHLKSNFSFEHIYDPIPCLHIDTFVSLLVHRWTLFFSHDPLLQDIKIFLTSIDAQISLTS